MKSKKNLTRVLSMLLAVVMVAGMLPVTSLAAPATGGATVYYNGMRRNGSGNGEAYSVEAPMAASLFSMDGNDGIMLTDGGSEVVGSGDTHTDVRGNYKKGYINVGWDVSQNNSHLMRMSLVRISGDGNYASVAVESTNDADLSARGQKLNDALTGYIGHDNITVVSCDVCPYNEDEGSKSMLGKSYWSLGTNVLDYIGKGNDNAGKNFRASLASTLKSPVWVNSCLDEGIRGPAVKSLVDENLLRWASFNDSNYLVVKVPGEPGDSKDLEKSTDGFSSGALYKNGNNYGYAGKLIIHMLRQMSPELVDASDSVVLDEYLNSSDCVYRLIAEPLYKWTCHSTDTRYKDRVYMLTWREVASLRWYEINEYTGRSLLDDSKNLEGARNSDGDIPCYGFNGNTTAISVIAKHLCSKGGFYAYSIKNTEEGSLVEFGKCGDRDRQCILPYNSEFESLEGGLLDNTVVTYSGRVPYSLSIIGPEQVKGNYPTSVSMTVSKETVGNVPEGNTDTYLFMLGVRSVTLTDGKNTKTLTGDELWEAFGVVGETRVPAKLFLNSSVGDIWYDGGWYGSTSFTTDYFGIGDVDYTIVWPFTLSDGKSCTFSFAYKDSDSSTYRLDKVDCFVKEVIPTTAFTDSVNVWTEPHRSGHPVWTSKMPYQMSLVVKDGISYYHDGSSSDGFIINLRDDIVSGTLESGKARTLTFINDYGSKLMKRGGNTGETYEISYYPSYEWLNNDGSARIANGLSRVWVKVNKADGEYDWAQQEAWIAGAGAAVGVTDATWEDCGNGWKVIDRVPSITDDVYRQNLFCQNYMLAPGDSVCVIPDVHSEFSCFESSGSTPSTMLYCNDPDVIDNSGLDEDEVGISEFEWTWDNTTNCAWVGYISSLSTGQTVIPGSLILDNGTPETGDAHLIIDYNLPGVAATTDEPTSGIVANPTTKCGDHPVGTILGLRPYVQAKDYTGYLDPSNAAARTLVHSEYWDKTISGASANASVEIRFKGLFTAAEGGDPVPVNAETGHYEYELKDKGLTTLYAQWEVVRNLDVVSDTTPVPDDPGTATRESKLYTVYYDQAYIGGGITSSLWGTFYVPIAMKAAYYKMSHTGGEHCTVTDGPWIWVNGGQGDWDANLDSQWDVSKSYKVTIEFTHPADPVRPGYTFVGWTNLHGYQNIVKTTKGFVWNADSVYDATGDPDGSNLKNAKAILKNINIDSRSPMFGSDGLTLNGVASAESEQITYYAAWMASPICWDANGGSWEKKVTDGNKRFFNISSTCYRWPGALITGGYVDIVGGNGTPPERTGYEFDQWYYQSTCTVPLVEMDHGVQPMRNYYAGWIPQPVYVNYYDTREGTSLLTTQEYKYDDYLMLLDKIKDTSGERFVSWTDKNGKAVNTGLLLDESALVPHATNKDDIQVDYSTYWTLDLYADYEHQTAKYTVTLDWDDDTNNDGVRPTEVTVGLIDSRGNSVIDTKTMTGGATAKQWSTTFSDLDVTTSDASTEKVTYSFCVLGYKDVNGNEYTVADTGATSGEIQVQTRSGIGSTDAMTTYSYALNRYSLDGVSGQYSSYNGHIYMNHNLILTGDDIKFTIQWDDDYDRDGQRPKALTLVLFNQNGVAVQPNANLTGNSHEQSVTAAMCEVSPDGSTWTYTFKDYQKYTNVGKLAGYMVGISDGVRAGYTVEYLDGGSSCDENGVILHYVPKTVNPSVTIKWDDESDRDGTRPDSVDVKLVAYQWNDKTYRWETVDVDTKTVARNNAVNQQSVSWTGLNKYSGGKEIIYKAEVVSDLDANVLENPSDKSVTNNGYTWTAQTAGNTASTVTIHHDINRVDVTAVAEWDDNVNVDTLRPQAVRFKLYGGAQQMTQDVDVPVVTGGMTENTWTYVFRNMPMNQAGKHGQRVVYRLEVTEIAEGDLYGDYIDTPNGEQERIVRYEASYIGADGQATDVAADSVQPYVRLTHGQNTGTIYVYASWHDEMNKDGKRPSSLLIDLYKQVDGERVYLETVNLSAGRDNSWTYVMSGLPLFEGGKKITYLADISEDYRSQLQESVQYTVASQGLNVHLYYTPEVGFVTTQVHWDDDNNNDNVRPDRLVATLLANGRDTGKTAELTESNGWTATWSDLDSYFRDKNGVGQKMVYTVQVATPDGYIEAAYQPAGTTTVDPETIHINLSHEARTVDKAVTVLWNDGNDNDGLRPDQVGVQLYADGEPVAARKLDVTGIGNTWTAEFTGLPEYRDGKLVHYTAQLDDNVVGYDSISAGMNVYMSHAMATGDLYVSFRFDDRKDADGLRPEGAYLTLTANGEAVNEADYEHTTYVDADGLVNDMFYGLPVYSTGRNKIQYNVQVEWDDSKFGGESAAYDVTTTRDITLSENSQNANQLVIVAKLREQKTLTQNGVVYWFDNNNQRGDRRSEITINVFDDAHAYRIGEYVLDSASESVYLTSDVARENPVGTVSVEPWGFHGEATQWLYTIDDLPENAIYDGESHKVTYYATAQATGLTPWYSVIDGQANGMNINLTHIKYVEDRPASTQDFTVNINWLDNSNAWNYRPEKNGVDVALMYMTVDGAKAKETVHLTRQNAMSDNPDVWTYTFRNLPTYLEGNAVEWTACVTDMADGSDVWYTGDIAGRGADYVTLKMVQAVGFDLTLRWDDDNDNDRVRPACVRVGVYGDGQLKDVVFMRLDDYNTYTGTVEMLPVYRELGDGVPVRYTFGWYGEDGSTLADLRYNASATMGGEAVDSDGWYWVSVENWGDRDDAGLDRGAKYRWETTLTRANETYDEVFGTIRFDDAGDQDGIRPETLFVQLYGTVGDEIFEVGEPVAIQPEDGQDLAEWTLGWKDLDVKKGGEDVKYTIDLVGEVDGYAKSLSEDGRTVTLYHEPETVTVTAVFTFDDSSEAHYHYNQYGDLTSTSYSIERVPFRFIVTADGTDYASGAYAPGESEDESGVVTRTWTVEKYRDHGTAIEYDVTVGSEELGSALANGRSKLEETKTAYNKNFRLYRDLFDVTGTVYYLYVGDDFLAKNVPVTAYLYQEATGKYEAVGNTVTGADGKYEITNVPQGTLIVRATYQNGDYSYAGSTGLVLGKHDGVADLLVNRDAAIDSDLYRYSVIGKASYQTDATDDGTIVPVADGSIALLYKMVNGNTQVEYVGMTQTKGGQYSFGGLESGSYVVNIVFDYEGGVYTYDNADAVKDGLTFVVSGADRVWPDIVKQVGGKVDIKPVDPVEPTPDEPVVPELTACVVGGSVFFNENGVHTTDPVAGVDVYVYTASNVEAGRAVTDGNGAWSVAKLPVGDYIAVFSYQGNASRVLRFTVSEADFEEGELTVAEQYFDRVVSQPTAIIKGVVLDEGGNRVQALVQVLDEAGNVVDFGYADKNGFYEFTVTAGFTYTVRVQEVGIDRVVYAAGDPDDGFTELDYYVVSGRAVVNGEAQANKTVAVYRQNGDLDFELLTWTLTDGQGNYSVKLAEAGNYQVAIRMEDGKSATHKFSVGYQEWEPVVTENGDGTYTISGQESFDNIMLQETSTGVVVREFTGKAGEAYEFTGLKAGTYDLTMLQGLVEKHYYIDCPDDVVSVTWYETVSGTVSGKDHAVLGSVAGLYDKDGKQVGGDIVITDGSYGWENVPAGEYEIRVEYPTDGKVLGEKSTTEADSYNKSYPGGMTENGVWVWNMNAKTVNGIVTDQKGQGVANATVVVKSKADASLAFGGMTDETGAFSVGVIDGDYTVDAMFEFDNDHVYHAVKAFDVTVDGGDADGLELVIPRYEVSGKTVRDGDGQALAGVAVTVSYRDGTVVDQLVSDENGEFSVVLWGDDYKFTAGFGGETTESAVAVGGDKSVTLSLGMTMTLSGTVYDVDGSVVTDGIVYYDGAKSGTVYTDENGQYAITLVASELGGYSLWAEAAGNRSGTVAVSVVGDTVQDLELEASKPDVELRTLSGIVTDNKGNRLADTVVTVAYGDDKAKTMTTSTNREGAYRFLVEDGTYYLTAVYQPGNGESYETNAETVAHVTGGDKADADLVIRMSYDVMVTVVDTNGEPIADAYVSFSGADSGVEKTGADGVVYLTLKGGSYELRAVYGNRESAVKDYTVKRDGGVELVIGLVGLAVNPPEVGASDLTIAGTVHDEDGNVVRGATVTLYRLDGEDGDEEWTLAGETESGRDGYYEFTGLESGRYRVEVEFTVETTVETEADYFDICDYACDTNGNPFVDAQVNLYDGTGELVATVYTDETGYFEFLSIEQGSYTVEVIPVNTSDNEDDESMSWDVDSDISSCVISGVAADAAGNVVEGATVIVSDGDGLELSMVTDETGEYRFEVDGGKEYTVTVTYPKSVMVETEGYEPDGSDPNTPEVFDDGYGIFGVVTNTDDETVDGATVTLEKDGEVIGQVTIKADGGYGFTGLRPGDYQVTVEWNGESLTYDIDTDGNVVAPEKPDEPVAPVDKIRLSGVVVTDRKKPLAGAVITVTELDTGVTFQLVADKDGRFDTGELERGRYELSAEYFHVKGSNVSDTVSSVRSQDNMALVIVLSYVADVNGDGTDETVYAGQDDGFDTPDDFYVADVANDGVRDDVFAGSDGQPGTSDDWYVWDGTDKVYVAGDRLPGTEDDWYTGKVDGKDETVYVGKDGTPVTPDDWYYKDVDVDGRDKQVFVGDDAKAGTEDDWYLDGSGNKAPVAVWVRFKANGGTVEDGSEYAVKISELKRLPTAILKDSRFNGWFLRTSGGSSLSLGDIWKFDKSTVVYAQWTANSSSSSGGGGGGSFGGGGGGGGTPAPAPVEIVDPETPLDAWGYRVKEVLNTDDHMAYVRGSDDGLVHPTADITRAEVAMIFYRLLREDVRDQYKTDINSFVDVSADSWYVTAVSTLARMGIVTGRGNGVFDPDVKITRAEFATIAARFDEMESTTAGFIDVDVDHWAYEYIISAASKGWIQGTGGGYFHPERNITRAEVMTLVNRMLGRDSLTVDSLLDGMTIWADNMDTGVWYYLAVQEATNAHEPIWTAQSEVWHELTATVVSDH